MTRSARNRPFRDMLWLFAGPAIWFLAFSALYAAETVVCLAPRPAAMPIAALVIVVLGLGALALIALRMLCERPDDAGAFMRVSSWLLVGLSALATLWTGAPLLLLDACVAPAA